MEFELDQATDVLAATPRVLKAMLADAGEVWVHSRYGADTFSPYDVVGHLIHGERTDWIPRLRRILEHGESKPFDPFDRTAMRQESRGQGMGEMLETFEKLRTENLAALGGLGLSRDALERRGRHPELGSVTLRQLLATWVVHDLNHLHQIAKCMAHQYRAEVGPWRAYLPVLGLVGER